MHLRWMFLAAYACSGMAGLIYQVNWTRLLTLQMGHGTAAVSTVVGAFMGGLGGGSILVARFASRLTGRQALVAYVVLESVVVAAALMLPSELAGMTPILRWSYRDGTSGLLFPFVRLLLCLLLVFVPAAALMLALVSRSSTSSTGARSESAASWVRRNVSIFRGFPFSRTTKSLASRSRTGTPPFVVTLTTT